jgi:hypothetical protein
VTNRGEATKIAKIGAPAHATFEASPVEGLPILTLAGLPRGRGAIRVPRLLRLICRELISTAAAGCGLLSNCQISPAGSVLVPAAPALGTGEVILSRVHYFCQWAEREELEARDEEARKTWVSAVLTRMGAVAVKVVRITQRQIGYTCNYEHRHAGYVRRITGPAQGQRETLGTRAGRTGRNARRN